MPLQRFDSPALLTDFNGVAQQSDGWSQYISATINNNIKSVETSEGVGAGRCQFYNEMVNPVQAPQELKVTWNAFPLLLVRRFGRAAALAMADELVIASGGSFDDILASFPGVVLMTRQQDEYCEWRVQRDPSTHQITRITFTCEGPEYWQALAGGTSIYDDSPPAKFGAPGDKPTLLRLYQQLVGSQNVQLDDLFFDPPNNTTYNPWNKWNSTDGLVHLHQINNTLGAEINIGVRATVLRTKGGAGMPDARHLICCSGFGAVERSSDPSLGFTVNKLAVQGRRLTLRNPIGIYMDSIDLSGFTRPNPTAGGPRLPIGNWWKVVRGVTDATGQPGSGMIVRAVFEVPAGEKGPDGKQLTVSDVQIAGVPITHGGHVAEQITMKFVALAGPPGEITNPPQPCATKCCKQQGILNVVELTASCQDVFPVVSGPSSLAARAAVSGRPIPKLSQSRRPGA